MSKGLLDLLFDPLINEIFDDSWRGRYGEKLTAKELRWVNIFGRKGKTLRNVYIPKANGETSEIDLLYITQKGIFVFESKNYSGWIFGDEKSQYWTAMLPNREKNRFYNPIKQNRTHIKWLRQYVGNGIPMFSIIVFSERCELKKVTVESSDVKVIKRDRTYATVRNIWDVSEDVLSEKDVEDLYARLGELTDVDKAVKAAHIAAIQSRQINRKPAPTHRPQQNSLHSTADLPAYNKTAENTNTHIAGTFICPRCGRELVLRTAKKGDNAGKQFYGCSGFPKCRYIKNI